MRITLFIKLKYFIINMDNYIDSELINLPPDKVVFIKSLFIMD